MKNKTKWFAIGGGAVLAAAAVAVGVVLVISGGKGEKEERPAGNKQETTSQGAPASPEGTPGSEGPVSAQGEAESIMDVICEASGIAAMSDGSLLVTDTYSKVIWRVQAHNGVSTVYAGGETVEDIYGKPVGGYNDADLKDSYFKCPWAIVPFLDGWAVSDADNNAIRLITKDRVQTVNGSTTEKLTIRDLGVVFDHPTGLAVDKDGNLYVSDTHSGAIRMVTEKGKVSTVAENLDNPMGLFWKDGALYVAETGANRIVKIEGSKTEVIAGSGESDQLDGAAQEAAFSFPQGVTVGEDGTIYVADTGNSAVRLIKNGQVTTLLGRDRTSLEMTPISPVGLLLKGNDLYICDNFTRKVLKVAVK